MVVEGLADMAWEDLIRRELFAPLGLATGGFGAPGGRSGGTLAGMFSGGLLGTLLGQGNVAQPWGHVPGEGGYTDVPPFDPAASDNKPLTGPAGTIHMSLPDLARYAAFHASKGRMVPGYLRPETIEVLHVAAAGEGYAMGWGINPAQVGDFCTTLLLHEGSNGAWYTVIMIAPKLGRAWVMVTNACNPVLQDSERGPSISLSLLDDSWIARAPEVA